MIDGPSIVKENWGKGNHSIDEGQVENWKYHNIQGNVSEMLQNMEELWNDILEEGKNHQDFTIDLLNDLAEVQDKAFLLTLENTQDYYDSREDISNDLIIQ